MELTGVLLASYACADVANMSTNHIINFSCLKGCHINISMRFPKYLQKV